MFDRPQGKLIKMFNVNQKFREGKQIQGKITKRQIIEKLKNC